MTFDGHAHLRIVFEKFGGLGERLARVGTQIGLVEVKVSVLDVGAKELVQARIRRGPGVLCRSGMDGDTNAGLRRAAGSSRGDLIRSGLGGLNDLRALRRNFAYARREIQIGRVSGSPGEGDVIPRVDAGGRRINGNRWFSGDRGRRR